MNYAGCVEGGLPAGFTASLWVPPNKLKLLKIRHALHEALHCNKSRSATQWPMAAAHAMANGSGRGSGSAVNVAARNVRAIFAIF